MAIIMCPGCGHPVSDKAVRCPQCKMQLNINQVSEKIVCQECGASFLTSYAECPNCGWPVGAMDKRKNVIVKLQSSNTHPQNHKGINFSKIVMLLSAIIVIGILVCIPHFTKSTETEQKIDLAIPETDTSLSSNQDSFDASSVEVKFLDLSMFSEVWKTGIYKCGVDIDPGEYYLLSIYAGKAIYNVSNSADDFPFVGYGVIYKISIKEKQYVQVPNGMLLSTANEVESRAWNEQGIFLVGKDLPAGEYKIERLTEEYHGNGVIITNISAGYHIFDNQPGVSPISGDYVRDAQKYITVEDGQYLALRNARLTLIEEMKSLSSTPTTNEEKTEKEIIDNTKESQVYTTLKKIRSITKSDLSKEKSYSGNYCYYYYNGLILQPEDTDVLDAWWNSEGVLPQDAIYNTLAMHLEGFNMGLNDGSAYAKMMIGFTPDTKKAFEPYVKNASQFIRTDDALYHILKKMETLDCVYGTFDFKNDMFIFSVSDLEKCAEEMMISEEMLGYIFGVLDIYAFDFNFQGNTCRISYRALHDFGW